MKWWDDGLSTWGPWWANVQRVYHPQLGKFWGAKLGSFALYVRWNKPHGGA